MPSFRDFLGGKIQAARNFPHKTFKGKIVACGPETMMEGTKEERTSLTITLNNWDKPFRLGAENCESLGEKWGENYLKWVGKHVEITVVPRSVDGQSCKGFAMKPIGGK